MITCPWCGTNYTAFQSNCKNCGGLLPLPSSAAAQPDELILPPPAPRPILDRYVWKLFFADGWFISAMVFSIFSDRCAYAFVFIRLHRLYCNAC